MSLPKTYKAYRRTRGDLPRTIEPTIEHLPKELAPDEVIIKIHAVSLNFRDVGMLNGKYPVPVQEHGIAASDCAAEVVAIGSNVKDFNIGDRVSPCFNLSDLTGKERDGISQTLGGDVGVLAEYAVFDQKVLVHLPKHLTWEEASTIPCCGVTAWNSLKRPNLVDEDTSALLQGTGGVSMFALLICIAAGITPIITSSSDSKLESIKNLSPAIKAFNYHTHPNQAEEVKRLTDGKGVDIVINNTGPASFPADLESLRQNHGTISLVGFLEDKKADWDPNAILGLMVKGASIQGIRVGSKADLEEVNRFLEEKSVRLDKIIDRTFWFDEAKDAFDYLWSGKHVGKIVVKI
ncbi:NAD(P)-binding protein [Lindgomyces ingoldianus]|uniref:NAD(P)-binding protein n=1 Tax=Lindgomyces ingoldianus TaxID=673940 RepID=A0ACB6R5L5_9PLEO|nr:NAD(P)-binding protein [Lindgomyces ingoldianus]KAF2474446.1 NAD(P)-binding protein [Lindgomyces ingoldianus]